MTEPTLDWTQEDTRAVDNARVLTMDAVQRCGSGHPGAAMSLAPAAYLLYQKVMRHDPSDPQWPGRDRFILSCGHASLLQYVQLFFAGYQVSLEDLKALRQFGSNTPAHPEVGHTPGVETSTGPLGQGFANAVGMAMAARRERGIFDAAAPVGESCFDHTIYVIASDGDIQEGVTSEASSLAGTQQLGNLVVIYDRNRISIEDDTDIALSEDTAARYESYDWHVQTVDWTGGNGPASGKDGTYREDIPQLHQALCAARAETAKPSLIILDTVIAWPAPNAMNTGESHGAALGEAEVAATKEVLGFDPQQHFEVDQAALDRSRQAQHRADEAHQEWEKRFTAWKVENPEKFALWLRMRDRLLPEDWTQAIPSFEAGKDLATRKASGDVLQAVKDVLPELWGGSADLGDNTSAVLKGESSFAPPHISTRLWGQGDWYGRVLHFGVREHAMAAIANGIALHGGTRIFVSTFMVFCDYLRPAMRLSAIMQVPVTYIFTHDSIGIGEDGPTHQPVEHLAAMRAIPGLDVVRPADANEVAWAWRTIVSQHDRPAALCLTRQNVPIFARGGEENCCAPAQDVARGGYVIRAADCEADGKAPDVIVVATGSEVQLALAAQDELRDQGIYARVVSMPCREWFDAQDAGYRNAVLLPHVKARVSIEAGVAQGWREIVGDCGRIISMDTFGASGTPEILFQHYGFTSQAVVDAAKDSIQAAAECCRNQH